MSAPVSCCQARTTGAKASLTSKRSMSFNCRPAFFKTFAVAGIGPVSMMVGSEPTIAWATMRARGLSPSAFALSAVMMRTAAAPSLIWLELPAVTTPSSWKEGLSCAIFSRDGGMRTPSSVSTR